MSQKKLDRKFRDGQKINIFLYDTQSRSFYKWQKGKEKKMFETEVYLGRKETLEAYVYVQVHVSWQNQNEKKNV